MHHGWWWPILPLLAICYHGIQSWGERDISQTGDDDDPRSRTSPTLYKDFQLPLLSISLSSPLQIIWFPVDSPRPMHLFLMKISGIQTDPVGHEATAAALDTRRFTSSCVRSSEFITCCRSTGPSHPAFPASRLSLHCRFNAISGCLISLCWLRRLRSLITIRLDISAWLINLFLMCFFSSLFWMTHPWRRVSTGTPVATSIQNMTVVSICGY